MAKKQITPFQEEQLKVAKEIANYKISCEANIVAIAYKQPDLLYDLKLDIEREITNNIWRVYGTIAQDLVCNENKTILDEVTIGMYLNKHPRLSKKYDEYGGFETIQNASKYVEVNNFDGYLQELKKWNSVMNLVKRGFPVYDRLNDYCDLTAEQIYEEFEAYLNDTFSQVDYGVKSYDACAGLEQLIEELDEGQAVGMPFANADILNREIGGFNLNGQIYTLGASSGVGKSTMMINYLLPSCMKYNEKIVIIINEEDQTKVQKELLIWVANNVFDEKFQKYQLRDGKFTKEQRELLFKCADWLKEKGDNHLLTVIPLERYSANIVTKIIKKYASMGVRLFVLDTMKESYDASTDEIWKSMSKDMINLYDVVKPASKNVGLFVTYQLAKGSLQSRYLTNNNIGKAKNIIDTVSVNLMMRRPYEDEYEGGKNQLTCYKMTGKNNKTKIPMKLRKDKKYMITFICKNRFGEANNYQIVSECDLSTNRHEDVGICNVPQDW